MADALTLIRLNNFLNKAGFDDDEILGGVKFKPEGLRKIGAAMGVRATDVEDLIDELRVKLRGEQRRIAETYDLVLEGSRYGYEKDALGNVTIRDTETGEDTFLRGAEAQELLNALKGGDEQAILSSYVTEGLDEAEAPDTYDDEINSDRGSYNFPWSYDGETGFATAEYSGRERMKIRLVSVRDSEGDEVQTDDAMRASLTKQAFSFIGEV